MSKTEDSLIGRIQSSLQSLLESARRLFRSIFSRDSQVLFLGIDNAGKTTLIHKLRKDMTNTYEPTRAPSAYDIEIGNMKTAAVDLGGHEAARLAWAEYFIKCDGIVFLVDVADEPRYHIVNEAWRTVSELRTKAILQANPSIAESYPDTITLDNLNDALVSNQIAQNSFTPLPCVVLMNKVDRLDHTSASIQNDPHLMDYIQNETGIYESPHKLAPVRIVWLSLVKEGLEGGILDAFVWLDKMMQQGK